MFHGIEYLNIAKQENFLKDNFYLKVNSGEKIFCEGERSAIKIKNELKRKGIKTNIGCNEEGMWNVYII